ncbi:MAG: hypothetical protein KAT90_04060, partial [Gammaproteobacteria bacterium]|nr:hypothetical protein [Gammaproteobacteria bacterium]
RSKKRSLHVVYRYATPHFDLIFNAVLREKTFVQRSQLEAKHSNNFFWQSKLLSHKKSSLSV